MGWCQQVQFPIMYGQVAVGRDHKYRVGLQHHPVLHLRHLHGSVTLQQVAQDAFMVRVQMLDQNKSHTGIRR